MKIDAKARRVSIDALISNVRSFAPIQPKFVECWIINKLEEDPEMLRIFRNRYRWTRKYSALEAYLKDEFNRWCLSTLHICDDSKCEKTWCKTNREAKEIAKKRGLIH